MNTLLGGATVGLMGIDGNCTTVFVVGHGGQLAVKELQVWVTWHPTSFTTQTTCSVVLRSTNYNVCVSALAPVSPSKTTCLLPSPAGGVDKEMVGFLMSHLKEFKQLRKVEMTGCSYLSSSLLATICEGLCSSNSVEDVEVTTLVSVLLVCLTTPYKLLSSVSKLPLIISTLVWLHLTGDSPFFLSLRGSPHDAVQLTVLFIQFFFAVAVLTSTVLYSL